MTVQHKADLAADRERRVPLERLCGSPMEIGRFLQLATGMTSALTELHARNVLHKSITPQSILVDPEGNGATIVGFAGDSRSTGEAGTAAPARRSNSALAYMSPEQTGRMNRTVDSRSDLYSLGIVFYEMLTGSVPFRAADALEWVHCHVARVPRAAAEVLPAIPPVVSEIVAKLLAKTAEGRFQTASGLKADLEKCLAQWEAKGSIDPFALGEADFPDRLLIPHALYGRERDVSALQLAFSRVVERGVPEVVMVAGYSGIGKTSLVRELHKTIVREDGLFISGKFDQSKRNVPYSTIVEAFRELIQQILTASEDRIAQWRQDIQSALGINAQLIVDIIPQVELIIGAQRPVPDLPMSEEGHRFNMVFRRFVGVFTKKEHPLVVFLDDLQWADSASLKLLEHLLADPDTTYLLLVGAYRDNEVGPSHPLLQTLERIGSERVTLQTITLCPLSFEDVRRLLVDTLRTDSIRLEPLTGLVFDKTAGNPFFVIQFMTTLHREHLLEFDRAAQLWRWDIGRIQAKGYTDNVVDLMARKLIGLTHGAQQALRLAACVGNRFDLDTLAAIGGVPIERPEPPIDEALREGLLLRSAERSFAFLHDRVQQAAYSLIPELQRPAVHLEIGRLLLARTPPEMLEERIFDVVKQFNLGVALISDQDEKHRLAQLNLLAGRRAKAAIANASAVSYFTAGISLLAHDSWDSQYDLTYCLHLHRAECEYLNGSFAEAEQILSLILRHARTKMDTAAATRVKIQLSMTQGRNDKAVEAAAECLQLFRIHLSPHPTWDQVQLEYDKVQAALVRRQIEDLIDLPDMADPDTKAAMEVLSVTITPSVYTDKNLLILVLCHMVNLSLTSGITDASASGFVWFGVVLGGPAFREFQKAFRFGKLAYDLVAKRHMAGQKGKVLVTFASLINPWTQHLRSSIDVLRVGFDAALQAGDLTYACYACQHLIVQLITKGGSLGDVYHESEARLAFVRRVKFGLSECVIISQQRLIQNLRGLTSNFSTFNDAQFDEHEFETYLAKNEKNLASAAFRYYIRKLQARFMSEDYEEALLAMARAKDLLWTSPSFLEVPEYYYYGGLALAAHHGKAPAEKRVQYLETLADHQKQLEQWQANCPANFLNRYALISAELARIGGRELEAERLYEEAIGSARENEFVQNEGIANELASRFYRERGLATIADAYLREARACYTRWGADGKVRQLERKHPWLAAELHGGGGHGLGAQVGHLDAITLVKASQAISGEIVLSSLLDTLMRTVIENAGAQRGCLALLHGEELTIEAEATVEGPLVSVSEPGRDRLRAIPASIVNYVRRTHESVMLADASEQNAFFADEEVGGERPVSVLCLPLMRQANLVGMLYLENRLVKGAFTADRIAVLELLAAQAAISLENAALYLERSRAEAALRQSEATYRALFENSGTALMFIEEDMTISMVNKEFEKLSGTSKREVEGRKKWTEFVAKRDDLQRMLQYHRLRRIDPGAAPQTYEFRFAGAGGALADVVISIVMMPGMKQSLAALLDVTERRKAEEALRESESKYRTLVNNVNIGVYRNTPGSGRFIQANPAMAKIFGYDSPEELLQGRVVDLYQNAADRESFLRELARRGFVKDRELALKKKDGTPIRCSATATAQYDENGSIAWTDGVIEDVTERKSLEEQLRQAQKMEAIGTLAGGVAHDFNNILTAIKGYGGLLKMQLRLDDPSSADVDAILMSAERAANLTRSLLAFSRKQLISPRPVNLNEIVTRIERLLRRLIGEDIDLRTRLAAGPLPVFADASQLEQVLMNLAANARDAMPRGGALSIETERAAVTSELAGMHGPIGPGEYAVLSVSDTGKGIDEATKRRIFEPFFTTKEVGKGTGLGLATVYGIVKQHAGEIDLRSEPGKGTTFRIYLKLVDAGVEDARSGEVSPRLGGSETILVAEDDAAVRKFTTRLLEKYGYAVIEAVDGEEACRRFEQNSDRIGLVILDVVMPKMNGKEVYEQIMRMKPTSRVLFSSGYTAEIIHQKGLREEGIDFVSKPVDPDTLLAKVREALSR